MTYNKVPTSIVSLPLEFLFKAGQELRELTLAFSTQNRITS